MRIVRGHELTQADLNPIHIGTPGGIGITGPPARIAASPSPRTAPQAAAAGPPPVVTRTPNGGGVPETATPAAPPGSGAEPARGGGRR